MSNKDLAVSVIMGLVDRFSGRTAPIINAFTRMGDSGAGAMRRIGGATKLLSDNLDSLGNRYTALLTAAAGGEIVKGILETQRRLKDLGVHAGESAQQVEDLRRKLFAVANDKDILINPNNLLDAVDRIVERTGDLEFAKNNLREIALVMRASGASGGDVGDMISDFSEKFGIRDPKQMLDMMDMINNQGHAGHFLLKDMAQYSERMTAAYAATGRTGPDAVRDMGATLNVIKEGAGGVERAGMAFEMLMMSLEDAQKRKLLSSVGIKIMDPDNPKQMRAVSDIIKDLVRATHGDLEKLGMFFDHRALKGLRTVAEEYNKTGRFDTLDKLLKEPGDGARLMRDAASSADELDASLEGIHTIIKQHFYQEMDGPIRKLNHALQSIDGSKLKGVIDLALKGGEAFMGLVVLNKIIREGMSIAGTVGMLGGKGGVLSKLAPQPVFVINWPSSFGFGSGAGWRADLEKMTGGGAAVAAAGGGPSWLARAGAFGLRAAPYAALLPVAVSTYDLGVGLGSHDKALRMKEEGRMGGMFGGTAIGAGIGSIVPGIGTAIGAIAGGLIGYMGGGKGGEWLGHRAQDRIDAGGTIHIKVDDARTTVTGHPNDPRLNYDVDTGYVMGGG